MEMSEQSLTHFKRNQQDFLRQFVTTDETWVNYYTPETKQESINGNMLSQHHQRNQRQYGWPERS